MATSKLLILLLACIYTNALPSQQEPVTRNTIFLDEKLEGEIFENVDDFNVLSTADIQRFRLPTTTRPIHYNVLWAIDMTRQVFSGTVEIQLAATAANVSEIVIHAHDMVTTSVVLRLGTTVVPQTFTRDAALHFLTVRLTSGTLQFTPNAVYSLTIDFNGNLRDDMYGIYKSWFRNNATESVRWMASTQFQATAARFAFPCYDEPSFKATFDITIRRPLSFRSWSCTNIVRQISQVINYQDDVYARTPLMSTYLIALLVADYDSMSLRNATTNQITYEVIARAAALNVTSNQGIYALDVGQRLTEKMGEHMNMEFFGIHPNLKMTHAAIPDFSAGAMENWGLITYREAYIMYDPDHTNDYFKQLIAYIVSHEVTHMWFGNLVTCDFWDNLWLNEGFARYYQYFLTHWVEGFMGLDIRFINEQVHTALLFDSSETAHALTNPVGSPESVRSMFSTVSYNKGAAVIRMTEHLLGTDVHTRGLQNYLVERSFDTALPIHLFQALQNAAVVSNATVQYGNFSVIDYYRSWTEQSGHPILLVQVNHRTGVMTVTQRRFSINTGYAVNNLNYIVPITFATASNPDFTNLKPSHILTQGVTVIDRGSVGDQWVLFNKQQSGFYRVNYDPYTWDLIVIALRGPNRTAIHEYNRAQIVNDVFQFARAGLVSYDRAFNIISFLENETQYTPWVAAITGFNWLRNRLIGTAYQTRLDNLIIRLATNIMNQLTYSPIAGESFMRSYLRYQLAPVMCRLNVTACRTAATTQFELLVNGTSEVPVNSRPWVYCNALRNGNESDFNFLWNRYLNHNVYTEKIVILQNLGCTPVPESLNALLTSIITTNHEIRPQDYNSAFNAALTGNEENTQIVLRYIQNNLQNVLNVLGVSALSSVIARFRTTAEISTFQTWANQNQAALGTNNYNTVLQNIQSTVQSLQWVDTVADDLTDYFDRGDAVINASTSTQAPITTPSTVTAPPLIEPSTPSIPDSAVTSVLSVLALLVAFFANIIV